MLVGTPLDWFGQTMVLVFLIALVTAICLGAATRSRLRFEETGVRMTWREAFGGGGYKLPPDASMEVWRLHVRGALAMTVAFIAFLTIGSEGPASIHRTVVMSATAAGIVMHLGMLAYQSHRRRARKRRRGL